MPTYEYECRKCGATFEKFQRISEPPIKRCPKCRGAVRRLMGTGAGLLFKGSGFYVTDYRSDNYKKSQKSESGTTASPPKSEPSKSGPATGTST